MDAGGAAGGAEEVLEQGDQDNEREAVEQRGKEGGEQAQREEAAVGPDQAEEPELGTHAYPWRGVSRAIGRITSSGETPPWRNAPR